MPWQFPKALAAAAVLGLCVVAPAHAQWLTYKTPGIPRLPDGKPNLSAPAPRMPDGKPDFSGLWRTDAAGVPATSKAMDAVKPQPWAAALTKKRKELLQRDSPNILCLPSGVQIDDDVGKIVQSSNMLVMLWSGTQYREIFLDGRPLPVDPNPDWMGYSVGHWEEIRWSLTVRVSTTRPGWTGTVIRILNGCMSRNESIVRISATWK